MAVLCSLFAGCKSAPATAQPGGPSVPAIRVWPQPPAEPRIALLQTVSKPGDLGFRVTGFRRFTEWLTGTGKGVDKFNKPFGITEDQAGTLCITDTGEGVVWLLDRREKRFHRWDRISRHQMISPVAVAAANEIIFIADSSTAKVLAATDRGRFLFEIGHQFVRPSGLAVAAGKLYVADAQLHTVFVFDLLGKFLSSFGRRGAGPGEFNFPTHIAAAPDGQLYVTDSMNSRVQVFDSAGRYQRTIGGVGDSSGHFSRPKGVAVDSANRVYVIDSLFDNVQIFDQQGRFLLNFGQAGTAPGEFWLPNGIAITPENEIYITDSYNQRVQIFKYIGP